MIRYLQIFLIAVIVDFYWFPISSTFATTVNTKMIMAVVGLILLALNVIRNREYSLNKYLFGAGLMAGLYSVVNLIAVEVNDQFDFSYANYITTFFVWTFGAYAATQAIQWGHGKVTIRLLTAYLAAICAVQCVLAIAMDLVEPLKNAIDSVVYIEEDFFKEVDRIYGIGCALDPAGTRFSIVLILISFVLTVDEQVKQSKSAIIWFLVAFAIITSIGNIISRTTTVGLGLAMLTFALSTGIYRFVITASSVKLYAALGSIILMFVPIAVFLYNTDPYFYDQFRYGFEGFFNWVERGEWTTGSTEVLDTMWKWPTTTKGWIIGTGEYGTFRWGTDIGYCRLVLYSGVVGFGVFALFFVYHAFVFINRYRHYRYMFILLLVLSFLIWWKVSTDLYMIHALFYTFIDKDEAGFTPKLALQ